MATQSRLWKLEGVRGFAALYVLVHHLANAVIGQSGWKALPFRFGQEAVIVFFLLSGFVIEYSVRRTSAEDFHFSDYFRRRAWRIYPLYLAALALAYLSQCWQQGRLASADWKPLFGNLAMLQSIDFMVPGTWFPPYQANAPLWSLAFEWTFYMAFFPVRKYVPERWRRTVVAAIAFAGVGTFVVWHNPISVYASYFGIWWSGVELAREFSETGRVTLGRQWTHWAGVLGVMAVWGLIAWHEPVRRIGLYPLIQLRHFGTALGMLGAAYLWYRARFVGFKLLIGPFARLAPYSYGLYVMHHPVVSSPLLAQFHSVALGTAVTFFVALGTGVLAEWVAVRYLPTGKKRARPVAAPAVLPAQG